MDRMARFLGSTGNPGHRCPRLCSAIREIRAEKAHLLSAHYNKHKACLCLNNNSDIKAPACAICAPPLVRSPIASRSSVQYYMSKLDLSTNLWAIVSHDKKLIIKQETVFHPSGWPVTTGKAHTINNGYWIDKICFGRGTTT